ncbi:hypothetical protein ScPMuIL_014178 [Solemya velum]
MSAGFVSDSQVVQHSEARSENNNQHIPLKTIPVTPVTTSTNFISLAHPNSQILLDNTVPSIAYTFPIGVNASAAIYTINEGQPGMRLPVIAQTKDGKDTILTGQLINPTHFSKIFSHGGECVARTDSQEMNANSVEDKRIRISPLPMIPVTFQDGEHSSPVSSTSNSQVLRFQPSGNSGDAMLSAINYNENEILQDGPFEVGVGSLPALDDGILENMNTTGNIRLTENPGSSTFDLFDGEGNVNDSYNMESLSPQPFQDHSATFGLADSNNIASVADTEKAGNPGLSNSTNPIEQPSNPPKQKSKSRPVKSQGSPSRLLLQCQQCGKSFNNSSALAKHKLTHSDERKYICNVCAKAFKRQDHLNGHLMTHRDKKPYECHIEGCEKSYCDARSLRRHLENHHQQTAQQIADAMVTATAHAAAVLAAAANNPLPTSIQVPVTTQQSQLPHTEPVQTVSNIESGLFHESSNPVSASFRHSPQSSSGTPVTSPSFIKQQQTQFFPFEIHNTPVTQSTQPTVIHQPSQANPLDSQSSSQSWSEPTQVFVGQFAAVPQQSSEPSQHIGNQSPGYLQQISPVSPVTVIPQAQPTSPMHPPARVWFTAPATTVPAPTPEHKSDENKPVQCNICERRFKNIPALNGHMRLHGGYFKKDNCGKEESKKSKKHEMAPPPTPHSKATVQTTTQAPPVPAMTQSFQTTDDQPSHQTIASFPGTHQSFSLDSTEAQQILQQPVTIQTLQQLHQFQEKLQQQKKQELLREQQLQLQQRQQQEQQLQQQLQQQIQELQLQNPQLQQQHLEQIHPTYDSQDPQQQLQLNTLQLQQVAAGLSSSTLHGTALPQSPLQVKSVPHSPLQVNSVPPSPIQVTSVPLSPQIPQSPQLQRQSSMEAVKVEFNPAETFQQQKQDFQQVQAQVHLQQLAKQQQLVHQQQQQQQQLQHMSHDDRELQHLGIDLQQQQVNLDIPTQATQPLPSPLVSLTPVSIQSNLQSALAQIPQFRTNNNFSTENAASSHVSFIPQEQSSAGQMNLEPTNNPNLTVSHILSSMETNLPDSVVSALDLPNPPLLSSDIQTNHQDITIPYPNQQSLFNPASRSSSQINQQTIQNILSESVLKKKRSQLTSGSGVVKSLDSTVTSVKQELLKHLSSKPNSPRAAPSDPYSFQSSPPSDGSSNDFTKELSLQSFRVQHRSVDSCELKRRLSTGYEDVHQKRDFSSSNLASLLNKGSVSNSHTKTVPKKIEGRSRMRSKSGDDYKTRRHGDSHGLMRPRSRTEDSLFRPKIRWDDSLDSDYHKDMFSQSDGAGLFRNPNFYTSSFKMKRKNRPAPLIIPPGTNSCGFQSRLRSPRLWEGGDGKFGTPPPYTPPPMLSPIRSGSGLFWQLHNSHKPMTPMSAPIISKGILSRALSDSQFAIIPFFSHVNVGPQYQVDIPDFSRKSDAQKDFMKADLMWDPHDVVQSYQDFACSAAVRGSGTNEEYALHLLHLTKGSIQEAMLKLMDPMNRLPANHTLLSYIYQESDTWSTEEIEAYQQVLLKCDKDFFKIAKEVKTKTTKQCIQFYYLWKKVCPDEYKRLRTQRRKRESDALYNLRTKAEESAKQEEAAAVAAAAESSCTDYSTSNDIPNQNVSPEISVHSASASPATGYPCDFPECSAIFSSKQALNGHARIHGGGAVKNNPDVLPQSGQSRGPGRPPKPHNTAPRKPPQNNVVEGVFPCKLCGRVFSKVKSRSAHMKSHRVVEAERNRAKVMELTKSQGSLNA